MQFIAYNFDNEIYEGKIILLFYLVQIPLWYIIIIFNDIFIIFKNLHLVLHIFNFKYTILKVQHNIYWMNEKNGNII